MGNSIVVTESYLNSVYKLNPITKKQTFSMIKQLAENSKSASLSIHTINKNKCDPTFRSARVNDDFRVILSMQGEIFTLLYVDHHDAAYDWCEGKYLKKTDFGAEYIYDEKVMLAERNIKENVDYLNMDFQIPLLTKAEVKEKNLVKLGIPSIHAANLLKIKNEDSLLDYITIFPAEIQEAIIDLATGNKTFDDVYNELLDDKYENNDNKTMTQKDSRRRFYITKSIEELQKLMENDEFEKWLLFLHPSQERLVQQNFNGPVLVEGGPGTGKTIVGIHRAAYLAQNVFKAVDGKRILLCTFSKKLVKVISQKMDVLMKQRGITNNVDVLSVDSFIFNVLKDSLGRAPQVNPAEFSNMVKRLYQALTPKESLEFYLHEYYEVIERYNIKTLNEYLIVDRTGMKVPLNNKERVQAWSFFEVLLQSKVKDNIYTFVDRAYVLLNGIENGTVQPKYDSIIIDEAQDLEPAKLRALISCVKTTANNIMILSDTNQRIFTLSTWKNDIGANIAGRTYYLSVNYRTTKQINDYARYQFVHSEMTTTHVKEYKSVMAGVEPTIVGLQTAAEQLKYIVAIVKQLLERGYLNKRICIICPTRADCQQVQSVLLFSDIAATILVDDIAPHESNGICVCPITGVKGLEFEVVIVYDYNNIGKARNLDGSSDMTINFNKLIECEKYVAATRARDELIISYVEVNQE